MNTRSENTILKGVKNEYNIIPAWGQGWVKPKISIIKESIKIAIQINDNNLNISIRVNL
jgi:hypothetical protein